MRNTLLTIGLLVCVYTYALQKDSLETITLDKIDITDSYTQTASIDRHSVIKTTKDNILSLPKTHLNDILDELPSIDIRTRGTDGAQADVSLRGGTTDQVLVLLNGINFTDPRTGHANLDLPIDLNSVQSIEVIQGGDVSLFGQNAFSGAINILTMPKFETGWHFGASLKGGSFGYFAPAYFMGQHSEKTRKNGETIQTDWQLNANYSRSGGFRHNTDYQYGNLYLSGESGDFCWQIGGQIKDFGSNGFYTLKYPDQYEKTKMLLASVGWNRQIIKNLQLQANLYYRVHHDKWYLFRPKSKNYTDAYTPNRHLTQLGGGNLKLSYSYRFGKTGAGIEIRDEHILSNVLGKERKNTNSKYNKSANRLNVNYFLNQVFIFCERWSAEAGIAGNYNTAFGNNFTFNAQLSYRYAGQGSLYIGANRAIRMPTFNDLYYQSVTQISNPDLKEETAYCFELGTHYAKHFQSNWRITISANAYYRIGRNIIDWMKKPEDEKWQSMNHTHIDATGGFIEFNVGYKLFAFNVNYSFNHLMQSADNQYKDFISKYALDYLKHKVSMRFDHPIYKGLGVTWTFSYNLRNGSFINLNNQSESYKSAYLLGGRIYWQNKHIKVYAEADNLIGKTYYDYGGIDQPGRTFRAGIEVIF